MHLIYHPEAEAEFIETIEFYRSRSPELAARFLRAFESAIELIEENPLRWAPIQDDLRRVLLQRFPFGIYYRVEDQELRVLIVKHHRRHPDYGMDRLNS
jgi:plasmid stabilization system protein ParE